MANSRGNFRSRDEDVFESMFGGNINREEEMSVMVSALTHVVAGNQNVSSILGEKRGRDESSHATNTSHISGIFRFG